MSRNKRIQIYKKHTKVNNALYNHSQLFPEFSGKKRLSPAVSSKRKSCFDEFVKLYVPKHNALTSLQKKDIQEGFAAPAANGLQRNSRRFKILESFSRTDYGSSIVKEMVNNPKQYTSFVILEGATQQTQAVYGGITLGTQFPQEHFKYGRQAILPEAIIYHEFGHTQVFITANSTYHGHRDLKHEREVVIKLENPVRMIASPALEPRYTYTERMPEKPLKTINIITGDVIIGAYSVHKEDPRKFVPLGDKNALRV